MWQTIIEFVVSPIVAAFMGYVVWKLQQQSKWTHANNRGTMILLRDKIIEDHKKYCIDGMPMPSYAYENFCETYEAYKALGGNGMAEKMFAEMKTIGINRNQPQGGKK